MNLVLDLINYIVSKNICYGYGTDIFENHSPAEPDDIVAVSEYLGLPPVAGIDCAVRSIQIKVRSASAESARQKILDITSILDVEDSIIHIDAQRYCVVHLRHQPYKMGVDEVSRPLYVLNMGVTTNKDY